jgi:hypothetical protein
VDSWQSPNLWPAKVCDQRGNGAFVARDFSTLETRAIGVEQDGDKGQAFSAQDVVSAEFGNGRVVVA